MKKQIEAHTHQRERERERERDPCATKTEEQGEREGKTNKQCHIKNIAAREDLAVKDKNQTYKKITANGRDMGKRNDPHTHRLIL